MDGAANDATINEAAKFAVEAVRTSFQFFFPSSLTGFSTSSSLSSFSHLRTPSSSLLHNNNTRPPLQFVRVVQAEQQVVAGMNYRMVIEAAPGPAAAGANLAAAAAPSPSSPPKPALYTAVVYQPLGAGVPMQLTSWKEGISPSGG